MHINLQLQAFHCHDMDVQLYVPEPKTLKEAYRQQKKLQPDTPFPYWAKVWPAAMALGAFIRANPNFTANKQVLELAAGLGLPSLIAARYAQQVWCTDYLPQAVKAMQQSARYNKLHNMHCYLLDWNNIPEAVKTDVLLLSDINYEPAAFEQLYSVLQRFLNSSTTILLSTPQRLMGKAFIERLTTWVVQQEEITVGSENQQQPISILVMQQPGA